VADPEVLDWPTFGVIFGSFAFLPWREMHPYSIHLKKTRDKSNLLRNNIVFFLALLDWSLVRARLRRPRKQAENDKGLDILT
jgi:hypothetical protein